MGESSMARHTVFHCTEALLPDGWARNVRISVRDGIITAITRDVVGEADDVTIKTTLPGMPNLHSHAFQRGMAGLAEHRGDNREDSFWSWREVMYRFAARVTPDDLYAIAAQAYVEMLESGFTRVGEFHYLHHAPDGTRYADRAAMSNAVIGAAAESGIALTHLPVFYAHGGFDGAATAPRQQRFLHDIDGFAALLSATRASASALPDAVVGIAPHSLRAVTPDELAALLPLAGDAPVHIHIAEQTQEVADCLAWSGQRPVEWLFTHAPVDARWCLIHATHMTAEETQMLAASGAVAGLCPITEANLGDGIFPAVDYARHNGRWGIGSDSNVLIDASEELRLLEYGQRLTHQQRNLLAHASSRDAATGDSLWRGGVAGGAQALGVAAGLTIGASADFVTLDLHHPSLIGRDGPAQLDALVFAAGRAAIDGVWRRGVQQVAGGYHRDRDAIRARYRQTIAGLLA